MDQLTPLLLKWHRAWRRVHPIKRKAISWFGDVATGWWTGGLSGLGALGVRLTFSKTVQ